MYLLIKKGNQVGHIALAVIYIFFSVCGTKIKSGIEGRAWGESTETRLRVRLISISFKKIFLSKWVIVIIDRVIE